MLWKINILVISVLVFTIFAGNLCAQQIVVTEEGDRPGFRNIYLGMTRAEVEKAVKEDASISAMSGIRPSQFVKTKVGSYPVSLGFFYDNHGILYFISLLLPKVTADEIETALQEQVDFFYGVFRKRFGEPTYTRPTFPRKINLFDFNGPPLYRWVKDDVVRYIFLNMHDLKYGVGIIIVDERLAKIKRKEDEERKRIEQRKRIEREGVLDDF